MDLDLIKVIAATLSIATPLLFAALGETIAERSGVLNLGIEGTMVFSAFIGFWAAKLSGSLWVGLAAAISAGMALALLMAFLAVTLGLSQHVAGLGITLLGTGLALFFFRLAFPDPTLPPALAVPFQQLSVLPGTPLEPIFSQYGLTYAAFGLVPICWWVFYRTGFGLSLRACGDNPEAVDTAGVSVYRMRYAALLVGGALMGVAGGFLTLAYLNSFSFGIVAGRGWVAIALVILGNWNPARVMLGALLFAVFQALQLSWQARGVDLPYWFLLALPYLVTILALTLAGRNASYPAALLKPYKREG